MPKTPMGLAPASKEVLVAGGLITIEGPVVEAAWRLLMGANLKALRFPSVMNSEG